MINSRYLINYFVILLIVLSGNVYFSLKYPKETRYILILSALIMLVYSIIGKGQRFSKTSLRSLLILEFLITINFLLNTQNGVNLKNLLFMIILLISVFIIKERIEINSFKISYVKIMGWACIISLTCYFLSGVLSLSQFPFYKEELLGVDIFKYTFYHNWGWGIGTTRNSGMFWEPGAFQCYINLAILFLIFDKDKILNNKIGYYIIFIFTLITTQSTTGYIVFGLIILYTILTSRIKVKNVIARILLVILSILGVLYFMNSEVVNNKFNKDNASYTVRSNDLEQSLNLIGASPILGTGYLSDKLFVEIKDKGIEKNSNGLLAFIIQFGIITAAFYLGLLYRGIQKFFCVKLIDTTFIFLTFIIMFSSEPIILYPIWIYFLF